ncbi:MAG: hypothetical protein ABSB61_11830, partial [Anaerolineales bacterium]
RKPHSKMPAMEEREGPDKVPWARASWCAMVGEGALQDWNLGPAGYEPYGLIIDCRMLNPL